MFFLKVHHPREVYALGLFSNNDRWIAAMRTALKKRGRIREVNLPSKS